MTTEEKALALTLIAKARHLCTSSAFTDELCRDLANELERAIKHERAAIERERAAIEAHETDKKAFSDAVAGWVKADRKGADARRRASEHLVTFIIPDPEPDPLVEEIKKAAALIGQSITDVQAANITFYFAARGYKIERIEQ